MFILCTRGTRGLQGEGPEQPECVAGCHGVMCRSVGEGAHRPGLCREAHLNSFQQQAVQSVTAYRWEQDWPGTRQSGRVCLAGSFPGPGLRAGLSPGWGPARNGAQTPSFRWVHGGAVFQVFLGEQPCEKISGFKMPCLHCHLFL